MGQWVGKEQEFSTPALPPRPTTNSPERQGTFCISVSPPARWGQHSSLGKDWLVQQRPMKHPPDGGCRGRALPASHSLSIYSRKYRHISKDSDNLQEKKKKKSASKKRSNKSKSSLCTSYIFNGRELKFVI